MSWQASAYVTEHSHQHGSALALLHTIATHAHADGTGAFMSVTTLTEETRLKRRQVQRLLRRLEASGELLRSAVPHGSGTNRYTIVGVGVQQLPLLGASVVPITPKGSPPMRKRGVKGDAGGASSGAGGGVIQDALTGYGTVSEPNEASARSRAMAPVVPTRLPTTKEVAREQHAFGREAERVWLETARKVGSPYITRQHVRQVHELAIDSLRWATETQVLAAIRARMDPASAPIRIPEWARLHGEDERIHDHEQRRIEDRRAENALKDADATTWWTQMRAKHPGKNARQILEAEGIGMRGQLKPVGDIATRAVDRLKDTGS